MPSNGEGQANKILPPQNNAQEKLALSGLVESHRYRMNWAEWLPKAVKQLEAMCDSLKWRSTLAHWLDMEESLGYPNN
jgi:hypothetical protein